MSEIKTIAGGPPVPSTTLVQTDQVTILGDGSHERPLHGGSSSGVSTDGTTILGNGTPGNPLHAGPFDGTYRAAFRGGGPVTAQPGIPVFISFVNEIVPLVPPEVTTVQPSDVVAVNIAPGATPAFATVAGVVSAVNGDGSVQVVGGGFLTLTTAQWDVVTGGSGGLTLGHTYYPSAGTPGEITDVAPPGVGEFVTKIGTAISTTTMLVQPARPAQNLADLIFFASFAAQPLIAGTAVIVVTDNAVNAAVSNSTVVAGAAVGVVAGFIFNGEPIVQVGGVVTLTTGEWAAITSTAGMQAGVAYYVDTNANPGRLTSVAPTTGNKVQVGVGLSTTQLVLSAPSLQKLS